MPADTSHLNAALIVAAGRGSRMGHDNGGLAKQFADLGGRTVLSWPMQTFLEFPDISFVQVVIHPDDRALYDGAVGDLAAQTLPKLLAPVPGGASRRASTANGLEALKAVQPDTVLIHDAARPFVDPDIIAGLFTALETHDGAIPGIAVADTLKRATAHGAIDETVSREGLWQAQTPQAFRFAMICAAHEAAAQSARTDFTDDASIVEASGGTVGIIPGDHSLRKITTQADLAWAQARAQRLTQMETRVGQGFDVHAFGDGDAVILCGVKIPHVKKLSGHSDADVAMHALTDAILGAVGDGDIGTHFPPSDPQWHGADSVVFLEDALRRLKERGGRLSHIDVTLICEEPKIGPHRAAMTERLCAVLGLSGDRISIKATTTERLGFAGREEGIAAMATATVALPMW
ncbi:MAG: bifunctional 2-C-methyl-D-erythritol 4-phosphate cytidylyltransferase/2-C-methyl-D-erythritol 2,4-cyclodiphosphate synthase [Hyphomicrobiaceae bacterium]